MNLRRLIGRVFAMLVIAGLVVAPMVTPAGAKLLPAAAMADMSSMSADMPCCPDKQKSDGCADCPLIAMCMLKTAQADLSAAGTVLIRLPVRALPFVLQEPISDDLDRPPPDHPPRNLV